MTIGRIDTIMTPMTIPMANMATGFEASSSNLLFDGGFSNCTHWWASSGFGLGGLSIGSIVILVALAFIFYNKIIHL